MLGRLDLWPKRVVNTLTRSLANHLSSSTGSPASFECVVNNVKNNKNSTIIRHTEYTGTSRTLRIIRKSRQYLLPG